MGNDVLVIAGMHRSGTSLLTHWLHYCGLQVGERLVGADTGNVEGHFEDEDFFQLHQQILLDNGAHPDGLHPPEALVPSARELAGMRSLIAARNSSHAQWGWKEPRTCLFLDAYAALLPQAKYLVLLRDYREVVHSLLKRDFALLDNRYQAKSWPYRVAWKCFYRSIRLARHRRKHRQRYLQAWVVYNRMILRTLDQLPAHRYLVVSYTSMQSQCAEVFSYLSSRWSFRLRYKEFASVYRSELISRKADVAPIAVDAGLLAEARQVGARLQDYLQCSQRRLAALPAASMCGAD
nr:sulfotransferase [uncultured Duganella sp.]